MTEPPDYQQYLKSARWKAVRLWMLDYCDNTCEKCGAHKNLEVHHKTYERLGSEKMPDDLQVLCNECHEGLHERRRHGFEAGLETYASNKYGFDWKRLPRAAAIRQEFIAFINLDRK